MKPLITILNGSLGAREGNTSQLTGQMTALFGSQAEVSEVFLKDGIERNADAWIAQLARSQGFVFATGTYWDSWGSPMQRFFEDLTDHEGTDLWLGKPAAAIVTMHAVGGKEVLSRLQGVLVTLGLSLPPMSGLAYSLANHLALQSAPSEFHDDLWNPHDLEVLSHNLLEAIRGGKNWKSRPVDRGDPARRWI